MPGRERPQIVLIGIGGADAALVERFANEGKLPHLQRLIARGAMRVLQSVPNAVSQAAWASLMTGLNPGRHGLFYPLDRVAGTYDSRPATSGSCEGASLWQLASEGGRRVAVLNAPVTYPAEQVNGVFSCGALAPSLEAEGYAWPPEFAARVRQMAPDFVLHAEEPEDTAPDVILNRRLLSLEAKGRIAQQLLEREGFDLFALFLDEVAPVEQLFYHHFDCQHPQHTEQGRGMYGEAIARIYAAADEAVGSLEEVIPADAVVIVVSDHGVTRNSRGPLYLKALLRALELEVPVAPEGGVVRRAVHAAWEAAARMSSGKLLLETEVDFQRSKAWTQWCDGWSEVWINVRGRDPEGIVSQRGGEYEELIRQLKELLLGLRDTHSSQLVVQAVHAKEELYAGPYLHRAPDLLIRWKDTAVVSGLRGGDVVADVPVCEDRRTGVPRPEGLLIVCGAPALTDRLRSDPSIIDVAPTVLRLLGLQGAQDMDGAGLVD